MRKFQIAAVVAFGVAMIASAPLARAQTTDPVKVTVAFPFMVGQVMLPAGTYTVVPDYRTPGLLEIDSDNGSMSAMATVLSDDLTDRRGECQFQFVNFGGKYYLTRIDDGNGDVSDLVLPDAVQHFLQTSVRVKATQ